MPDGIGFFAIGLSAIEGGGAQYPQPLGYEKIADLSEVQALNVPDGATLALIAVEVAAVRYRDDQVEPTASEGMPVLVGCSIRYAGNLAVLRFVEQSPGAALSILYYSQPGLEGVTDGD